MNSESRVNKVFNEERIEQFNKPKERISSKDGKFPILNFMETSIMETSMDISGSFHADFKDYGNFPPNLRKEIAFADFLKINVILWKFPEISKNT